MNINLGRIVLYILKIIKSFFYAVTQIAWGIASILLLNIALAYLMKSTDSINLISNVFLNLESFIVKNVIWFVLVFFILYFYGEVKEEISK